MAIHKNINIRPFNIDLEEFFFSKIVYAALHKSINDFIDKVLNSTEGSRLLLKSNFLFSCMVQSTRA